MGLRRTTSQKQFKAIGWAKVYRNWASAHSYDGKNRGWNVSNNSLYIKSIQENKLPIEIETLTKTDRYNEYIMTGLRTIWGVSLETNRTRIWENPFGLFIKSIQKHIDEAFIEFVKSSEARLS